MPYLTQFLGRLKARDSITIRLTPLYIAAFFHGFVLWYATEKLFMKSIGFDNASIGFMVAVYSGIMLLAETPSGMLADRWSRKGVLILASLALAISSLTGGFSYSLWMFVVCSSFWGIFFAMYSGTYDSIIYDVLKEEGRDADEFEQIYGRVSVADSMALISGSLLGGIISTVYEPRVTFFLTIPSALFAILALSKFNEPSIHRLEKNTSLTLHIRATFQAVTKNRSLLPVLSILILASLLEFLLFEFDQLWFISLNTPTSWYGPANAVILATIGVSGLIARFIRVNRFMTPLILFTLSVGTVGLIVIHNALGVLISIFLVLTSILSLIITNTKILHNGLPSHVRSGASSAVSTLGRVAIIPTALLFGFISQNQGVYRAAWILTLPVAIIVGVVSYLTLQETKNYKRKN